MSTWIEELQMERHLMNPDTGELFDELKLSRMSEADRAKLVMLEGDADDILRISEAVAFMNRADRRDHNRRNGRHSNGDPK